MPARNKAEMSKRVARALERPVSEVTTVIDAFLDQIVRELASGNDVKLTGYFSLGTVVRKPRKARHPRTGETINVPARTKVCFSSGAKLKRWAESRLETKHFYGKRRDSDEIPRERFAVDADDITSAMDVLPEDPPEA